MLKLKSWLKSKLKKNKKNGSITRKGVKNQNENKR